MMKMCCNLTVLCLFVFDAQAHAGVWTFRWQKGQVLSYRVEHDTRVTEVLAGNRVEMSSRLKLVKRWHVDDVDEHGVATLRLQITSMRNEQTRPGGEALIFDSDHPDKSTPELHSQLGKFIGKTLTVLTVDAQGSVIKVLEGSAGQFESDLPFVIRLSSNEVKEGESWERRYPIVLKPPFGTGEKYQAIQHYQVIRFANSQAHLHLTTTINGLPKGASEQLPLLPRQPQGDIVFDISTGKVLQADLRIERELTGHQGAGSSYRFESRYTEQLME